MKTNVKDFICLYGAEVTVELLKSQYNFVCFAANSVPTQGSLCKPTKALDSHVITEINKLIRHRDDSITLKTNMGFLKFINL